MFARSISPKGALSTLNLGIIPIWRLTLAANAPADIGIALQYPNSDPRPNRPQIASMFLVALDCQNAKLSDLQEVAKVGFPKEGPSANKERLQEAMKILYQGDQKEGTVSELVAKSVHLVEIYYSIMTALRTGADAGGFYENWKWIVSREETGWDIPEKSD